MLKIRRILPAIILCAALAAVCAFPQANLTQILDSITNPDGTPFNGTVVIAWNGSSSSGSGTVSRLSASIKVDNGALSVLLVPTTTAPSGTYYVVTYNSADGTVTWSEVWQVPPSATPLNLSLVRQSSTKGSGVGGSGATPVQYATLPIAIGQVTDLGADLAALDTQVAALMATVGALAPNGSNVAFVDAETPAGSVNGANGAFTLAQTPSPSTSLSLYVNGLLQKSATDYSATGLAITFSTGRLPKTGDILEAYYRIPGTLSSVPNFVDGEIPAGAVNGANAAFTLATAPNPAASLRLYKNGVLLKATNDFTLSGATVTFVSGAIPQSGDLLQAGYRH